LLALGSVLLVMGIAEFGLRLIEPDYASENIMMLDPRFEYPAEYDPELGYVPKVGSHDRESTLWEIPIVVTPERMRGNGAARIEGEKVLAVGDSFTWGGWVADNETWPAYLEAQIGQPVLNGGVFGYGFDQIVMRAERLVPQLHPDFLIVSFIPHDILRCEQSYRYASKPYFSVEGNELVLRGVPVPKGQRLDTWSWLRWSQLANRILGGILGEGWALPQVVREHERGLDVARLLLPRLAALDTPILLVAQGSPGRTDHAPAQALLQYAKSYGLEILDLGATLDRHIELNPDALWEFFYEVPSPNGPVTGHMTKEGNAWVAEQIATTFSQLSSGSL
jgi:hypothetical protein